MEDAETNVSSDDSELGDEVTLGLVTSTGWVFFDSPGPFLGVAGLGRLGFEASGGLASFSEGRRFGLGPSLRGSGETISVALRRMICGGDAGRVRVDFGLGASFGVTAWALYAESCSLGLRDLGGVGRRSLGLSTCLCSGEGSLFLTGSVSVLCSNIDIRDVAGGIGLVSRISWFVAKESTLFAPKLCPRLALGGPRGL